MMQKATGFNDPYELVKCFVQNIQLNLESKVIDFGCGTGLCGQYLKQAGFTNIYGLDGSPDMLKIANEKKLYKQTWTLLVGLDELPQDCPTDCDMAVASACMIKGHFPNTCFREMLKTVKQGGYIAFTIRDIYLNSETDNGQGYNTELAKLVEEGKIAETYHSRYIKYKGL